MADTNDRQSSDHTRDLLRTKTFQDRVLYLGRTNRLFLLVAAMIMFVTAAFGVFQTLESEKNTKIQEINLKVLELRISEAQLSSLILVDTLKGLDESLRDLPDTPGKKAAQSQLGQAQLLAGRIADATKWTPVVATRSSLTFGLPSLVDEAFAQDSDGTVSKDVAPRDIEINMAKLWIVGFIFVVLGVTFIGAVAAVFFTTNQAVMNFATDTIKTLLGFFIGVCTTFMGVT